MHINSFFFFNFKSDSLLFLGCLLFWMFSFIAVMYRKDSHIPRWQESPVFNLEFLYIQILHLNVNASGIKSTCIRTYKNALIFFQVFIIIPSINIYGFYSLHFFLLFFLHKVSFPVKPTQSLYIQSQITCTSGTPHPFSIFYLFSLIIH